MNTPLKFLFSVAVFAVSDGLIQNAEAGGRSHGMRAVSASAHGAVRLRSDATGKRARPRAVRSRGRSAFKRKHKPKRALVLRGNRTAAGKRRVSARGHGRRGIVTTGTAKIAGRKAPVAGRSSGPASLPNRVTVYGWNPEKKRDIVGAAKGRTAVDDRASRWMRTSQHNTRAAATPMAFVKKLAARNGYAQRGSAPAGQQGNSVAIETLKIEHEAVDWSQSVDQHPDFMWISSARPNPPASAVKWPRTKGFGFVSMEDPSD